LHTATSKENRPEIKLGTQINPKPHLLLNLFGVLFTLLLGKVVDCLTALLSSNFGTSGCRHITTSTRRGYALDRACTGAGKNLGF